MYIPVFVCCEAVLSSLLERTPGVPRLGAGPGGQYTLLEGADIHLPRSPSPRSSINSRPSEMKRKDRASYKCLQGKNERRKN